MTDDLQQLLKIPNDRLDAINEVLLNPDTKIIKPFWMWLQKYGTPEEINRKAAEARKLENLYAKVRRNQPGVHQRSGMAGRAWQKAVSFISIADYRQKVLGDIAKNTKFADDFAVTLEVSALQYFPWVREMAECALGGTDTRSPGGSSKSAR